MDMIKGSMDRLISDFGVDDPAIMEAMVVEYGAPVYGLALSILRDPADAQDAAQDTFIRASAALSRYQVGTNFRAWLLKITVNNCRMTLRKRAARQALQQAWEALTQQAQPQPEAEVQVVQNENQDELWSLVESLDEKHRLVVELRFGHGMNVDEISQVLGVREKTVYTRLYNAFARLRSQIQGRPEFAHLWDEVQP